MKIFLLGIGEFVNELVNLVSGVVKFLIYFW